MSFLKTTYLARHWQCKSFNHFKYLFKSLPEHVGSQQNWRMKCLEHWSSQLTYNRPNMRTFLCLFELVNTFYLPMHEKNKQRKSSCADLMWNVTAIRVSPRRAAIAAGKLPSTDLMCLTAESCMGANLQQQKLRRRKLNKTNRLILIERNKGTEKSWHLDGEFICAHGLKDVATPGKTIYKVSFVKCSWFGINK